LKKDLILKESVKSIAYDIAKYILNLNISKEIEFIDKELPRIEKREADIVVRCKIDNKESILHIEIQNNNDSSMAYRMLRYYSDIKIAHKNMPVYQYLIYIGKEKMNMNSLIDDIGIKYSFTKIDMQTIDCEKFLNFDTPDALILSILCNFNNKDENEIVTYIVKRLNELSKNNGYQLSKYILSLEILSQNRGLQEKVKEAKEMLTNIDIEKLPHYKTVLLFETIKEMGMEMPSQIRGLPARVASPASQHRR